MKRAAFALALASFMAAASSGLAAEGRPADAIRTTAADAVPPLPPEYHVHDGGWLTVGYHPSARERIRPILVHANAIAAELAAELGRPRLERVELRVAALSEEMPRLSPHVELPPGAGATCFTDHRLIVMSLTTPLSADPPDLEASFRHQLAHLALAEAWGEAPLPAWFEEAYAVHTSGEDAALRAQTLTLASLRGQVLSLDELSIHFPPELPQASVARAQGADFVRFLLAEPGGVPFPQLVENARAHGSFAAALTATYGAEGHRIEEAFRADLAKRYSFIPVLLGGALLWLLLATFSVLRRRADRQGDAAASAPGEPRVLPPAAATPWVQARGEGLPLDPSAYGGAGPGAPPPPMRDVILPTVEVPKVEHDGRWHTLH